MEGHHYGTNLIKPCQVMVNSANRTWQWGCELQPPADTPTPASSIPILNASVDACGCPVQLGHMESNVKRPIYIYIYIYILYIKRERDGNNDIVIHG